MKYKKWLFLLEQKDDGFQEKNSFPILLLSFIPMLSYSLFSLFKAWHELHVTETIKLNRKCLSRSLAQMLLTVKLWYAPKNVLCSFPFALRWLIHSLQKVSSDNSESTCLNPHLLALWISLHIFCTKIEECYFTPCSPVSLFTYLKWILTWIAKEKVSNTSLSVFLLLYEEGCKHFSFTFSSVLFSTLNLAWEKLKN